MQAGAAGRLRDRDERLVAHMPLVRRIARRYCGAGLPFDDLVQEGSLGLLDALSTFDPDIGVEFTTYARFRIHRAIRNALTDRGRLVRLPKHVVERLRLLDRASARTFAATGRIPSPLELAACTGLPPEVVEATLAAAFATVSLDEPAAPDGSPLRDLVADPAAVDPETTAVEHDAARQVDEAVEHLPRRERQIVEHAFGLGMEQESIAEVAAELHLSPQRTRTIVTDALRRLRAELETVSTLVFG